MRTTLAELSKNLDGELLGNGDLVLTGLAPLGTATATDLTFMASPRYAASLRESAAGAVLIAPDAVADRPAVRVPDPFLAFITLLDRHAPRRHPAWGVDARAVVAEDALLGTDVSLGPFVTVSAGARLGNGVVAYPGAFIGEGCEIGDDSILFANAALYAGTRIGRNVLVHSGAVLGADGFGFHPLRDGSFRKIPHVGHVVVEDDVEIGANACIDRALMGDTVIGRGTKLDNLVQVAHNCSVGAHCVVAGQAGFSGSVTVGDRVQVGGQVGVADHVTIGARAAIMAQSGIASDVEPGGTVFGSPAVPSRRFMRAHIRTQRLGELFAEVKRLGERIEELSPAPGHAEGGAREP